jgi:hypothetical protein
MSISLQEGEQVRRRFGKRLIALKFESFTDLIAMCAKQIGQDRIHKCPDVDDLGAQFELDTEIPASLRCRQKGADQTCWSTNRLLALCRHCIARRQTINLTGYWTGF